MTDLTAYRSGIRIILGDPAGGRFGDALLDQAVRWALAAYSRVLPQVKTCTLTVTSAGREQSLASLTGLLNLLEVCFPYQTGSDALPVYPQWYFYRREACGFVYISGRRIPAAGEAIRLTFSAWHAISGLDGAAASTIPAEHEEIFLNGAAGKATMLRSLQLVEAYGSKTGEPEKLKDWSQGLLSGFLDDLLSLKSGQSLSGVLTGGWTLDRWDTPSAPGR